MIKNTPLKNVLWLYGNSFSKLLTKSVNEKVKTGGRAEKASCSRARAFVSVYPTKPFWEKLKFLAKSCNLAKTVFCWKIPN